MTNKSHISSYKYIWSLVSHTKYLIPSVVPEPGWVKSKKEWTSSVLTDILHDPYVVGFYYSLSRLSEEKRVDGRCGLCPTWFLDHHTRKLTNRVIPNITVPQFESRRKVPRSRYHVHLYPSTLRYTKPVESTRNPVSNVTYDPKTIGLIVGLYPRDRMIWVWVIYTHTHRHILLLKRIVTYI